MHVLIYTPTQVLFCQLTDYQKEIYQDFLKSKEVEEMLAGQRQVMMMIVCVCVCVCV